MLKYVVWIVGILGLLFSLELLAQKDDADIYNLRQEVKNTDNTPEKLVLLDRLIEALLYADALESLQKSDEMFQLAKNLNDRKRQAQALIHIAKSSFLLGNLTRSQEAIQTALVLCEENTFKEELVEAKIVLSQIKDKKNEKDAETTILEALQLTQENDFQSLEAEAYRVLGQIKSKGNISEAMNALQTSANLYENQGNFTETARSLGILADIKTGDEQQYTFNEALNFAEKGNDKRQMMDYLNRLGELAGRSQDGLNYYFQGFIIGQEYDFLQNGKKLTRSLEGISNTYKALAQGADTEKRKKEYELLAQKYEVLHNFLKNNDYDVEKFRAKLSEENPTLIPENTTQTQEKLRLLALQKQQLIIDNQAKSNKISVLEAAQAKAKLRHEQDSLIIAQKEREIDFLKGQLKNQEKSMTILKESYAQTIEKLTQKTRWNWIWWLVLGFLLLLGLVLFLWWRKKHREKIAEKNQETEKVNLQLNQQVQLLRTTQAQLKTTQEDNQILAKTLESEVKPHIEQLIADSGSNVHRLVIHQSGKQMLNLVNNVLDIYKMEDFSIHLYQQPHSLYKIILSALAQAGELLKRYEINVENKIDPFVYVECDSVLLERVFLTFIQNSLHYTEAGGLIRLRVEPIAEKVEIFYEDDGKIIPKEYLPKVFGKNPPQEARPYGLGMLFAKIIIEAHQEKISVNSENNKTYFKFTLPLVAEEVRQEIEKEVIRSETEFNFTEEEREMLLPFVEVFQETEIYETTALRNLLSSLDSPNSKNIENWRRALEKAIFNLEDKQYQQLIKEV